MKTEMTELGRERLIPEIADSWNLAFHTFFYEFAKKYCINKSVLDAGCGIGYCSNEISKVAIQVVATDYDLKALNFAHKRYLNNNIMYLCSDISFLPFKEELFDIVLCFEVIEHIRNHKSVLKELHRVLKAGGILLISTPNLKITRITRKARGTVFEPHVSEVDARSFKEELRQFFKIRYFWGVSRKGNFLYNFLRFVDQFNLRHYLFSPDIQKKLQSNIFGVNNSADIKDVRISRLQINQANHFLAVCEK